MAQTIKLKNSGTSSNIPSSLEHGELAINYADGKIFYKNSSNNIVEFALSSTATGVNVTGVSTNAALGLVFHTGGNTLQTDAHSELTFNPSTNILSVPKIGVGTSAPATLFNVFTDTGRDFRVDHGTANRTILSTDRGMIIKAGGGYSLDLDTNSSSGTLRFFANGSEVAKFDSSGNFTITGSNADLTLGATGNDITFNRNADNYINAQAGTSSNIIINPENRFVVNTSDTERLRVDSSGRLLIGTTSTTPGFSTTNGHAFHVGDASHISRDQGVALVINRGTNDGGIVQFRKSGTYVGGIESRSGAVTTMIFDPRTNGSGISGTTNGLIPTNQSGTPTNNHVDLGSSTNKFKDAHFSGTITGGQDFKATGNNMKLHAGGNHIINMDLNGKFYPQTHNAVDLGYSSTLAFKDLYLSGSIKHSGDMTIDVGGGDILLKDDGTWFGLIANTSSDLVIKSIIQDKDIIFKGNDGGSNVDALRLDMSQAGEADFNSAIKVAGGIVAHQTNRGVLEYASNVFKIRSYGATSGSGSITLSTGGGGASADTVALTLDSNQNATFSGSVSTDQINSDSFNLRNTSDGNMIKAISGGAVTLYHNENAVVKTNGSGLVVESGMNFNMTGNMMIGATTTPASRLHVQNSTTEEFLFETTNNSTRSQLEVKSPNSSGNPIQVRLSSMGDSNYGLLYTFTNHNLSFATNNAAPQMTLDTSGRLGIGTSPAQKLDVANGHIKLSAGYSLQWDNSHERIEQSDGNLEFFTNNSQQMTISGSNVGIGTSSPNSYSGYNALTINGSSGGLLDFETNGTFVAEVWGDGTAGLGLQAIGSRYIRFLTNSTERVRLSPDGKLGIGTSSPDAPLTIHNSSDPEIRVGYNSSQDHRLTWDSSKLFLDADPDNANNNSALGFRVDGSQVGYFTNSGNFGIGASTSLSYKFQVRNDVAASTDLDPASVRLYNNSDGGAAILFENGVSAKSKISFGVEGTGASTDETFIGFSTGANTSMSESARITSGGSLLVAKSDFTFTTTGIELRGGNGGARFIRSNAEPVIMNRTGSDGKIQGLYKDGVEIGSIGVDSGDNLYIAGSASNHAGLYLGTNVVAPLSAGSLTDDAVDIGNSDYRFQDANLSGTVNANNISVAEDIKHAGDSDTYISFESNSQVFYSGGTRSIDLNPGSIVLNEGGGDQDFRVEGVGKSHLLFTDAANGRVGINISNPTQTLDVNGGANASARFITGNSAAQFNQYNSGAVLWLDGSDGDFAGGDYFGLHAQSATDFYISYASARIMTLTSGSLVGIGEQNPDSQLHIKKSGPINITSGANRTGAVLTLEHDAQWENGYTGGDFYGGIEFKSGDGSSGQGLRAAIRSENTTYYNASNLVLQVANHDDNITDTKVEIETHAITFFTNNTSGTNQERAKITDEQLLVGKSASNIATQGVEISTTGQIVASQPGASALKVNRQTNEGALIQFYQGNNFRGEIGIFGSDPYIGLQDTGLRFGYAGLNNIIPFDVNDVQISDNATSLGHQNARFHDLNMGGTAYIGEKIAVGTTSADGLLHVYKGNSGHTWSFDGGDAFILENSDSVSINIATPASNSGNILFSDVNARGQGRISYTHHDDAMSFMTGGISNTRLFINSSGRVGINTVSPTTKLEVKDTGSTSLGDDANVMRVVGDDHTRLVIESTSTSGHRGCLVLKSDGGEEVDISTFGNNIMLFNVNRQEAMRIDANKRLIIGGTSYGASNSVGINSSGSAYFDSTATNVVEVNRTSNGNALAFHNSGSLVGSITLGNTSTAYNTSSDARLKDNIEDADDSGEKIDAIQVRQFDWKSTGKHQDFGMVAQELIHVAPDAVTVPENTGEMMSVDYSKLVPLLMKEIQQLRARVHKLEEEK